jgi:hypothetical protein
MIEITQNSKKIKLKQRLYELLLNTSAHGVPRLLRAKNLFFILMWLFFLCASILIGSYFVINTIFDYLKYETITSIQVITEEQSQFPSISFCSYPKIEQNNSSSSLINETILKFSYDSIEFSTNYYSHLIEEFNDDYYGKCFRFNSGKYNQTIYNSTTSGLDNGLYLNVYFNVSSSYDFTEMIFFIYNQSLPPLWLYNNGYWIRPGSWNYFEIERVFAQHLGEPYSDCLKNVSYFSLNKTIIDYILKLNRTYSQKDCFDLCSYMFTIKESDCNCTSSNLDQFFTDCYIHKIKRPCTREYIKNFRKNNQIKICSEYCPLECDSMNYVINTYNEQIPINGNISETASDYQFTQRFRTYEEANKHFIGLRVYYKNLKYTIISESPKMEVYNLVSNIGGNWSLFLGISFLSIIELVEIIIEIFLIILIE